MKNWTLITVAFLWFTIPSMLPVRMEAAELRRHSEIMESVNAVMAGLVPAIHVVKRK